MPLYFEGYWKARAAVQSMSEAELFDHIDALYGRDGLPEDYTVDDLRREALEQTRREFTDTSSLEYEHQQFWVGLGKIYAKLEKERDS